VNTERTPPKLFELVPYFALLASACAFYYVSGRTLFMYPRWNLAYGVPALVGIFLALAAFVRASRAKRSRLPSLVGLALNAVPFGFMVFVFFLGAMH
jgi:hypothetical protein